MVTATPPRNSVSKSSTPLEKQSTMEPITSRVEHVQKGKKNRRARASHRLAQHGDAATAARLEEVGFLEANTVRPLTADQYRFLVNPFEKACRCKANVVADLDGKLVNYLTDAYFRGAAADEGSGLLAALEYQCPVSTSKLPRARRALKEFRRLSPPGSRVQLPLLALMCIVGTALSRVTGEVAAMYLLAFICYLRPAGLLLLRVAQIVLQPQGSSTDSFEQVGLLLAPQKESRSSKTGQCDESVTMDWEKLPGLVRWVRRHVCGKAGSLPLWPLKEAARLAPEARSYGNRVWQRLNHNLDGTVRCPAPPQSVVSAGGLRRGGLELWYQRVGRG